MKRLGTVWMLLCACGILSAQSNYLLQSPDGKLKVTLTLGDKVTYTVHRGEQTLLDKSEIALVLADGTTLGHSARVQKVKQRSLSEKITAPFHHTPAFTATFNEMDFQLKGQYGIQFRAYNEGVAYRFYTSFKRPIEIRDEVAEFNFDQDYRSFLPYTTGKKDLFTTAFQNLYTVAPLTRADVNSIAFLPVTVDYGTGVKLTVLESDLENYPGMFVKAVGQTPALKGVFAPYPKTTSVGATRHQLFVGEREQMIAQTKGTRTFPWRILAITEKDTDMPTHNLVYALAAPNRIGDTSWIKAGQAAWEWWNDWGISGVDFQAGINMDTYKYYIDFASTHQIPFVVVDEGWYHPKSGDMLTVVPELNLPELVQYGKERNVNLILWTVFHVLDRQAEEACSRYASMGIKGFKVDFLDRDDQAAVETTYRIAEVTAKHKLTLDLHGFYKPTGLNRTYPHIINFEAVYGMEEVKWSKIEKDMVQYDVTMPYIRMMAGPIDYTPGAMRNANRKDFRDVYYDPMSQGTRCHQLAAYIVHDAPLVMLADHPTAYQREKECTDFITSIPSVGIDETRVLQGVLGEYIVSARRAGDNWYVGAMTNWTPRSLTLDFSFLPAGTYRATLFKDGVNAAKKATDYEVEERTVTNQSKATIQLAPGGGFSIRLLKQ